MLGWSGVGWVDGWRKVGEEWLAVNVGDVSLRVCEVDVDVGGGRWREWCGACGDDVLEKPLGACMHASEPSLNELLDKAGRPHHLTHASGGGRVGQCPAE